MGSTQKQLQMQQTTTLHFEERELAAAVVHDYIFLNKLKKRIIGLEKKVRSEKNKAVSLKKIVESYFCLFANCL